MVSDEGFVRCSSNDRVQGVLWCLCVCICVCAMCSPVRARGLCPRPGSSLQRDPTASPPPERERDEREEVHETMVGD